MDDTLSLGRTACCQPVPGREQTARDRWARPPGAWVGCHSYRFVDHHDVVVVEPHRNISQRESCAFALGAVRAQRRQIKVNDRPRGDSFALKRGLAIDEYRTLPNQV